MLVEGIRNAEIAADILKLNEEAADKIKDELENRPGSSAVILDSTFLAAVQSIDTTYFPAIQGQYNYDSVYDYDSLIGNYHDNMLQIGVK